jgi:hypothetical protein
MLAHRKRALTLTALGFVGLAATFSNWPSSDAQAAPWPATTQASDDDPHAGLLPTYNGAASCESCHVEQVAEFGASNHYQWRGKFGTINDFCGYPDINFGPSKLTTVFGTKVDGGCASCHPGMGQRPSSANYGNADCLTCHASEYRRTLVDTGGVWRFVPDLANMPPDIAVQGEPTRFACLTCHAYAGGGCNNKRGDMSDVLANPSRSQDVHMSTGMTCVDCHAAEDHRIAGRGVDLRIDEDVPMRDCTDCHNPMADHNEKVRRHLDRVACQSCHIPAFARTVSTDMLRDFREAEVNERGLFEPKITRQSNVVPVYAFWNGESEFYEFRDPVAPQQALARPLGSIDDGKLHPFKLHRAVQPQDPVTGAILPVKAGILFQTGNIDLAIRVGAQETGFDLGQGYTFVETRRFMGIFHEMPPARRAVRCEQCHDATNRVDFPALGYAPKPTRSGRPLCLSCHGRKEAMDFYKLHDKHVKDKRVGCAECHGFTR